MTSFRDWTPAKAAEHNAKVARDAQAARIKTGSTRTTALGPAVSGEVSEIPTVQNAHSCAQEPAVAVFGEKSTTSTHEDHFDRKAPDSEPEPVVRNDALEKGSPKKANSRLIQVRIISHRRRLIDPDNCIGKWHLDCCRYAGFIPEDSAAHIEYRISQEKVSSKDEEKTVIEIEVPD